MKPITMDDGSVDGALYVISGDLQRAVSASPTVRTMQEALDR